MLPEQAWLAQLEHVALLTNEALAMGDRSLATRARTELFAGLEGLRRAYPRNRVETQTKSARNELLRVYMVHGWHAEAEEVARLAVQGLELDRLCPNRQAVTRHCLARVLMEAGDLEKSHAELQRALDQSREFLELLRRGWQMRPELDRDAVYDMGGAG